MNVRHLTVGGCVKALAGSRRVSATISTEEVDRTGDVVRAAGCDYQGFMVTRSVLWNHDHDQPVAKCLSVDVGQAQVSSTCEFPEPGLSAKADEVYNLIKAGVINATSIGLLPIKTMPRGNRGLDILEWTLLEWSFVSVPANVGAGIVARAFAHGDPKGGTAGLPDECRNRFGEVLRLASPSELRYFQFGRSLGSLTDHEERQIDVAIILNTDGMA